jgi:hypothetical protein
LKLPNRFEDDGALDDCALADPNRFDVGADEVCCCAGHVKGCEAAVVEVLLLDENGLVEG